MPIKVEQLSYTYRTENHEIPALKNINFSIEDGEFAGIMGRSGCGKTTLVQMIAGLLIPTHGQVIIDGSDINQRNYNREILRKTVGIVFQYPEYQLFETTVEKDVSFGLKHSGLSKSDIKERVKQVLELMDFSFDNIRGKAPLSLSGGEKRRVAIAGVLAVNPKILIFDEPIAGLDSLGRKTFLRLIEKLIERGTTILMISHDADVLADHTKRLLVLDQGNLILDGPTKDIYSDLKRMEQLKLGVSTSRRLAEKLNSQGFHIPQNTITYEGLLSAICSEYNKFLSEPEGRSI